MTRFTRFLFVVGAILWCIAALRMAASECAAQEECEDCLQFDTGPQRRDL